MGINTLASRPTIDRNMALLYLEQLTNYIQEQDTAPIFSPNGTNFREFQRYQELRDWLDDSYEPGIANITFSFLNTATALQEKALNDGYLVSIDFVTGECQTLIGNRVYNINPITEETRIHHQFKYNEFTGDLEIINWDGCIRQKDIMSVGGAVWGP